MHCASGVKSLTGLKSMSGCWLSMRTICAWQLSMSVSCCVLVKSVMSRFLVLADRSGPFARNQGPRRSAQEPNDTHQIEVVNSSANSNGRDSGLAENPGGELESRL